MIAMWIIIGFAVVCILCMGSYRIGFGNGYINGRDKVVKIWSEIYDLICANKPEGDIVKKKHDWIERCIYYEKSKYANERIYKGGS